MSSQPPDHNLSIHAARTEAEAIGSRRLRDLLDAMDPHPLTSVAPTPYHDYMQRFTNRVMVEVRRLESASSVTELPDPIAESLGRETPRSVPGSALEYFQTFARRLWTQIRTDDTSDALSHTIPQADNPARNYSLWIAAAIVLLLLTLSTLWWRPFDADPDSLIRTFSISRTTPTSLEGYTTDQIVEYYRPYFRNQLQFSTDEESTFVNLYSGYIDDIGRFDSDELRVRMDLSEQVSSTDTSGIVQGSAQRIFDLERQKTIRVQQFFETLKHQFGTRTATHWLLLQQHLDENPILENSGTYD